MIPFSQAVFMCLGFGLGNFLYQAFSRRPEWVATAFQTYSQWAAILVCWFCWGRP